MFCAKCGSQVQDGAKFCPSCGNVMPTAGQPAGRPAPGAAPGGQPGGRPGMPGNGAMPGGRPGMPGNGAMPGGRPGMPGNGAMPGGRPGMPSNGAMPGGPRMARGPQPRPVATQANPMTRWIHVGIQAVMLIFFLFVPWLKAGALGQTETISMGQMIIHMGDAFAAINEGDSSVAFVGVIMYFLIFVTLISLIAGIVITILKNSKIFTIITSVLPILFFVLCGLMILLVKAYINDQMGGYGSYFGGVVTFRMTVWAWIFMLLAVGNIVVAIVMEKTPVNAAMAGRPMGQPGAPAGRPMGQPGAPAGRPMGQPGAMAGRPMGQPGAMAGRPMGQPGAPTGRPMGQPGAPTGRPMGQPGVPTGRPMGQPGVPPVNRPVQPTPAPTPVPPVKMPEQNRPDPSVVVKTPTPSSSAGSSAFSQAGDLDPVDDKDKTKIFTGDFDK